MKTKDLIEMLETLDEDFPDAEVRIASQPSYPFEYSIRDLVIGNEDNGGEPRVVYILEGDQLCYASKNL